MGVDKDGLGLAVVIVLVVVLLGLPGGVRRGQSRVLTSGRDVVSLEDPLDIKYRVPSFAKLLNHMYLLLNLLIKIKFLSDFNICKFH